MFCTYIIICKYDTKGYNFQHLYNQAFYRMHISTGHVSYIPLLKNARIFLQGQSSVKHNQQLQSTQQWAQTGPSI